MKSVKRIHVLTIVAAMLAITAAVVVTRKALAQQRQSSFTSVVEEPFEVVRARDKAAKARVMAEHQRLLEQRYDLARRVDESVRMTRGKPIPVGPTARLKNGVTWDQLDQMTPEEIDIWTKAIEPKK